MTPLIFFAACSRAGTPQHLFALGGHTVLEDCYTLCVVEWHSCCARLNTDEAPRYVSCLATRDSPASEATQLHGLATSSVYPIKTTFRCNRVRNKRSKWLGRVLRRKDEGMKESPNEFITINFEQPVSDKRSKGRPSKRQIGCTEQVI